MAYLGGYATGYADELFDFDLALDEEDLYTLTVSESWP